MKANIAYMFELMPSREQKRKLAMLAGSRRFVVNKAIELQKQCLESNQPFLTYKQLCQKLTYWKQDNETLWLQEAFAQGLQQGLKDLSTSIKEFKTKRKGFPKFQARGDGDSFRIPKVGFVRFRKSRPIRGKIKQMTFSIDCGRWYISVVTEMDCTKDGPNRPGEVGIDLGIAQTVTLSDGTVFQLDVASIKKH